MGNDWVLFHENLCCLWTKALIKNKQTNKQEKCFSNQYDLILLNQRPSINKPNASVWLIRKNNCHFIKYFLDFKTLWKRLWCWEGLGAGGEGDDRGCDGWMASLTRWTRVWVNSGSWWWTGRPGVLQFMGSQRVGHDWATELNWDFKTITINRALYTFCYVLML